MTDKGCSLLILHLSYFMLFFLHSTQNAVSQCAETPVSFIFGDSNSDTGGLSAGLGFVMGPPNGRTFFHKPTGRSCDGRLIIDFLCESVNSSYLTPYLESLGSNFTNGADFAISGAATLPRYVPFSLDVQILQFNRFQARSIELTSKGVKDLVGEEGFKKALYIIDIGQNDLAGAFNYLSYPQVIDKIPSFIAEIKFAVWDIYNHGGRKFWVHNTGPLGCLPQKLATTNKNSSDLDPSGCLQSLNDGAKAFNEALRALCEELRSAMGDATIVYVDMYSLKYDLIANNTSYGFEKPLMACCGNGGPPYNYNPNVTCTQTGYEVCVEGSRYVSWDGVHYTEFANAIVAAKVLSTNYSTPPTKFDFFCNT